jgi:hypothetical protein
MKLLQFWIAVRLLKDFYFNYCRFQKSVADHFLVNKIDYTDYTTHMMISTNWPIIICQILTRKMQKHSKCQKFYKKKIIKSIK